MKDTLLSLLVFLLTFLGALGLYLGTYGISLALIPGGTGLIFANPFAGALLLGLIAGMLAAQYRAIRRPGHFPLTWTLLGAAFLLLLTLPIPLIQKMPPVRSSDASPLVPGRFLPLEDGSLLLAPPTPPDKTAATVLIPAGDGPMLVSTQTQFDALNQRFVFSNVEPKKLGSLGPERRYFEYPTSIIWFQTDLLAIYTSLQTSSSDDPLLFWVQSASVTLLFLGLMFFYSWRTWPLVQVVLVLIMARIAISFLVYALWSIPLVVDLWLPGSPVIRTWAPLFLVDAAAATLFFMTVLSKPHRQVARS